MPEDSSQRQIVSNAKAQQMVDLIIKNEEEYELALKRIEKLMDAEAGTPEGDELVRLTDMVEAYEDEHYPIDPPDPVALAEFRKEQNQKK